MYLAFNRQCTPPISSRNRYSCIQLNAIGRSTAHFSGISPYWSPYDSIFDRWNLLSLRSVSECEITVLQSPRSGIGVLENMTSRSLTVSRELWIWNRTPAVSAWSVLSQSSIQLHSLFLDGKTVTLFAIVGLFLCAPSLCWFFGKSTLDNY